MTSLNTDFGKYFLFIYLINWSNSLTFLSSKLLTLRFITLLLTVSNNTKHPFHIFFGTFKFLEFHRMRVGSGLGLCLGPVWVGFGLWKRTNSRSNGNKGKVGYNTFQRTSVLLFLHFNSSIRLNLQACNQQFWKMLASKTLMRFSAVFTKLRVKFGSNGPSDAMNSCRWVGITYALFLFCRFSMHIAVVYLLIYSI